MHICILPNSFHYIEYLVDKINKARLDPISLYEVYSLEAMLVREDQPLLERNDDDGEDEYKKKLIKVTIHSHKQVDNKHTQTHKTN